MTQPEPIIEKRELISRGRKFDFERLSVRRPAGSVVEREIVRHPGAVVIVPLLYIGSVPHVVLIRNYRISVGVWLLECCAGTIERPRVADLPNGEPVGFGAGEGPEVCAARELIEETGYEAGTLTPITPGWFFTTPGMTDEQMFVFLASDLRHVGQKLEEDESIEVVHVPWSDVRRLITGGEMRDAKSMLAIMLAERVMAE